ncbi:GNAT family N-acetyltransferase [Butyrivibrio sp. MC2013]|uniref:GNAT family N-acetyltransferase n=1 Tax=Butyrivibrio sp. MC2013 TaxID=1280686 RepID=UPI0003FA1DF4|nr:GNAT family N-acetyltransferase [Butyrivibrio sp. MC2013]
MIRVMTIDDYEGVYKLWMSIKGFGIRSIDDSRAGIEKFLRRNPNTCCVCEEDGEIVGAILCGHDGRRACFYHVCVRADHRRRHIGQHMVDFCLDRLREEEICKVALNAFVTNEGGNAFWQKMGWVLRSDMNYYDHPINEDNLTVFNI